MATKTQRNTKPKIKKKKDQEPTLYEGIKKGLEEAVAYFQGEDNGCIVYSIPITPTILAVRKLIETRRAAGLSQADVAQKSGLHIATISRLELGRMKNPTIDTLQKYAKALGCELTLTISPVA